MVKLTVKERVDNGVALLDKHDPKWREKIKASELYMRSCRDCVLGQLLGGYYPGDLGLKIDEDYTHGFEADFDGNEVEDYEALEKEWLTRL